MGLGKVDESVFTFAVNYYCDGGAGKEEDALSFHFGIWISIVVGCFEGCEVDQSAASWKRYVHNYYILRFSYRALRLTLERLYCVHSTELFSDKSSLLWRW